MVNVNLSSKEIAKKAAAKAAAALIQDGMIVGLGTGSTAQFFIESLIERCRDEKLKIAAVTTSKRSYSQAKTGGIPLYDVNEIIKVDITVDGADEIDSKKRMIKGGGGALLREKIVANMSNEMIVIVDPDKLVTHLGKFPLPIEIATFGYMATLHHMQELGFNGLLRLDSQGGLYLTDNGNYIVDVALKYPCVDPEAQNTLLQSIPGVLETGFFLGFAGRVLVGHPDGHVDVLL